ncbi:hypothetical protein GCM10016455_32370 [Aliiroseovarius zhejiangensis]|uniref:Type II secretion system protein n=1 Tax=Aliiroseovarius zhejiangensis TaxID=1632025 RepID=A0ABQ3JAW0_9RHOB|nr:hypothetical protein [Aliiroseovarius zhejiangensis]GHF08915.1 hypothetical protein GCM10016455_32370 [Aliiroseovarius zhejiangensis]
MQRDAIAPLLIGTVVLAAIAAGLAITGGPGSARAEKRDMARLADLRTLAAFVRCVAQTTGQVPETLTPVEECGTDLPLTDRASQTPYRYEALSETSFRLCAAFERPELITEYDMAGASWQPERGCFALSEP